jgi:hypothetical protein
MEVSRRSVEKEKEVALEHIEATAGSNNAIPEILRNYTPEQLATLEKKLVRKIDYRALPILIVLFLLNVLDRNAIANARLGGLEASLGIDDVQYQTAVMVLWAGYISMMVPSNMLLSIFKPRLYLPTVVIIWGIVSGATGFVQNHAGLVALRFLVGVTEALVHSQRTTESHSHFLLRIHTVFRLWWAHCSWHCRWHGGPWRLSVMEMDLHNRRSTDNSYGVRWICPSS